MRAVADLDHLADIDTRLVASPGLKIYAPTFANYNVAYGFLGAVIVLLLWFYLTAIELLAGAEITAQYERSNSA